MLRVRHFGVGGRCGAAPRFPSPCPRWAGSGSGLSPRLLPRARQLSHGPAAASAAQVSSCHRQPRQAAGPCGAMWGRVGLGTAPWLPWGVRGACAEPGAVPSPAAPTRLRPPRRRTLRPRDPPAPAASPRLLSTSFSLASGSPWGAGWWPPPSVASLPGRGAPHRLLLAPRARGSGSLLPQAPVAVAGAAPGLAQPGLRHRHHAGEGMGTPPGWSDRATAAPTPNAPFLHAGLSPGGAGAGPRAPCPCSASPAAGSGHLGTLGTLECLLQLLRGRRRLPRPEVPAVSGPRGVPTHPGAVRAPLSTRAPAAPVPTRGPGLVSASL